jgi:hypothetical protein
MGRFTAAAPSEPPSIDKPCVQARGNRESPVETAVKPRDREEGSRG